MTKSKVTFDITTKVCFVPSLGEMSEREIYFTWYDGAKFHQIKKQMFQTVKMMRTKGRHLHDCNYCQRGLEEHKSPAHAEQRIINIAAVLEEKRVQMSKEIKNGEEIRTASYNYSRWAESLHKKLLNQMQLMLEVQ